MTPLIKIKVLLDNTLEVDGIYDSGSNVSLINSRLLKTKQKPITNTTLKTINGVNTADGLITIKTKIFDIENMMNIFVINSKYFNYDFLIGLDCIQKFKLRQNEKLEIKQKIDQNLTGEHSKQDRRYEIKTEEKNNTINFNEHLDEENFKIIVNHLEYEEKNEIEKFIEKYKTVFAKDRYDIGAVRNYEAHIDLLVEKYPSKRPYRCTIEDRKEIEEQIAKLLEKNLIEESHSPFAAPVTLAYKREEGKKTRLCIDFRDLNKIVVPQAQPFPLIEDLMEKTRDCKYFTTLDINSAFWAIPLKIEDRRKTAFVTQEGHFHWTCLPFGLKTSPAIFQRILSNIIRKHKLSNFTVNYIDDILIFSKTFAEHIEHLKQLLKAIISEGFKLKFSKCIFARNWVKYLGHIIQNNSICPLKDNLISIRNFPIPKTQKNVRQFLGKINFYNKYIKDNAIILDPLHRLLRKNQQFMWTEDCHASFDKIKDLLCRQPILGIFDPKLPINIYTDASLKGIGAILKQPQKNGEEKPIAYFSKKLNDSQKKKKAIYLECLAIKEAVKYWQHRLIGQEFTVFSDHKPLENMNVKCRTDEELGDLTYYLSQYNLKIKYAPGKYNLEADCLSRNPVLESNENEDEQLKTVNLIKIEEIIKDQKQNKTLQSEKEKMIKKNRIYYRTIKKKEKIVLSEKLSIDLIKKIHEQYCHIGIEQMKNKINPFYTSRNLILNIRKTCKNCITCIKNKSRGQKKYGLLSQLGPAERPFEIMSIDTIGGFGGSRTTKKYLHLLADHFTRYAWILTSKTQNANDFIRLVNYITTDQKIGMILTDQYPGINSKEFKDFLEKEKITLIFTAVNTPFSNGLNERLNQTLINKIRCTINDKEKKVTWTTIAQECTKKYNETEHTVTGFTPKYLLEGENTTILPEELKQGKTKTNLQNDRILALDRTKQSHNYNKNIYDKGRTQLEFKSGDIVFVENNNKLNRRKLDELRIGPYKILKKISNSIYEIDTGHKKTESNMFHISKLTPAPVH